MDVQSDRDVQATPGPSGPAGGSVHFTAQGDTGVSTGARKVLDTIAGLAPELNLALGDFSYQAGLEQEFCDMVTGKLGQALLSTSTGPAAGTKPSSMMTMWTTSTTATSMSFM